MDLSLTLHSVPASLKILYPNAKMVETSFVASYGALGHMPPIEFWKTINLTAKISKITREKHVLHFRLSCHKNAKTRINRLKQSRN